MNRLPCPPFAHLFSEQLNGAIVIAALLLALSGCVNPSPADDEMQLTPSTKEQLRRYLDTMPSVACYESGAPISCTLEIEEYTL